jgi:hypothetical protein
MKTKEQALNWWSELNIYEKVIFMNKWSVEAYRSSNTLTDQEIEQIYLKEKSL